MVTDWRALLVTPSISILDAMKIINEVSMHGVVVVDENQHLVGTVTDGDIRRALLQSRGMHEQVATIMNRNPVFLTNHESNLSPLEIMKEKQINLLPIVDNDNRLIRIENLASLLKPRSRTNWVVIMAGGEGQRLRPLTENCPKPLLRVGGKPLLETIINNFKEHGFNRFYLSLNYMANMVVDYFGDGSKLDVEIQYINEEIPLGTAGAISLLPKLPQEPILVMNGDLLTKVNFKQLVDFHLAQDALGTMCIREYSIRVPYGVVALNDSRIAGLSEKPIHKFFVNAGIYVLEPEVVHSITRNTFIDMTTIFTQLFKEKKGVAAFPVCEYWLDIGQKEDFAQANGDYFKIFES
jgi:dTDP-glucose pyrophosphorylase